MVRARTALGFGVGVTCAALALARLASADPPATWWTPPPDDAGTASAPPEDAAPPPAEPSAPAPAAPDAAPRGEVEDAGAVTVDAGPAGYAPHETGFHLGLRAGLSVPFGLAKSDPNHTLLNDVIARSIPLGAELGYFFDRHLYVGGYLVYGFASNAGGPRANELCNDPSYTCTADVWRFGLSGRWHLRPEETLDPWVGAALGYEIVNVFATSDTDSAASALRGIELGVLMGLDIKPRAFFGLGPFIELSAGHFEKDSATAIHGAFAIGARIRTGL